jgi:8-oxo-dGTP pyrophosphatase MutT (NUDIX family)
LSEHRSVTPVTAATVILVRPAPDGFEVFMVRRHIKSDFASNVYVFPGGKVDPGDEEFSRVLELSRIPSYGAVEPACGWRSLYMAAVRELFEESGILLGRTALGPLNLSGEADGDRFAHHREEVRAGRLALSEMAEQEGVSYSGDNLKLFSNWVTPPILTKRFDTYFFLAEKPPFQEARHADLHELTDSLWITADQALYRYRRDSFPLVYATLRHLGQLSAFKTVNELFEFAQTNDVIPVHPQPVTKNGILEFLIPGDPGYVRASSE